MALITELAILSGLAIIVIQNRKAARQLRRLKVSIEEVITKQDATLVNQEEAKALLEKVSGEYDKVLVELQALKDAGQGATPEQVATLLDNQTKIGDFVQTMRDSLAGLDAKVEDAPPA